MFKHLAQRSERARILWLLGFALLAGASIALALLAASTLRDLPHQLTAPRATDWLTAVYATTLPVAITLLIFGAYKIRQHTTRKRPTQQ